jgi:hypothetical protein
LSSRSLSQADTSRLSERSNNEYETLQWWIPSQIRRTRAFSRCGLGPRWI